jgi:hypothetical protein
MGQWMKLKPDGWAVVTGGISGIVVLDFDGEDGKQTLEKIAIRPHVKTGSGGAHLYVQHPGFHVPTLNGKSKVDLGQKFPGLDIRADGGYAVFCGRNKSGEYKWLRKFEPEPLESIPRTVRLALGLDRQGPRTWEPASGHWQSLVTAALNRVSRHGRNNAGFWLACQLRDNGWSEAEGLAAIQHFASRVPATNSKGQIEPYTIAEATASLRQAYRAPARWPLTSSTSNHNGQHANGYKSPGRPDAEDLETIVPEGFEYDEEKGVSRIAEDSPRWICGPLQVTAYARTAENEEWAMRFSARFVRGTCCPRPERAAARSSTAPARKLSPQSAFAFFPDERPERVAFNVGKRRGEQLDQLMRYFCLPSSDRTR